MKTTRFIHFYLLLLGSCLGASSLMAQSFPLSENDWRSESFVDRFLGSYGMLTETEPKITEADSEVLQELVGLMKVDRIGEAITRISQYIQERESVQAEDPEEAGASAALDFTLGNLYLQNGNGARAKPAYERAIEKFPNFLRAYKNLGLTYLQDREYEEAIPLLVKAIELGDRNGDTFGLLAFAYLNTDDAVSALEGYRQAGLLNPKNVEWKIGKAEALMRTKRFREAISVFRKLLEEEPGRSGLYTSLANAYLSLGEEMKAASVLEILRRIDASNAVAMNLLGDIYINQNLPKLAQTVYIETLQGPSGEQVSSNRILRSVKALLNRGAYAEADRLIEVVRESAIDRLAPEDSLELLNLEARLALATGQDDEAAEILENVIAKDPVNGNALLLLGNYNRVQGDLETAEFYYERAAKIDGVAYDALIEHARMMVQERRYEKAIDLLEDAQALDYKDNVQNFLAAVRTIYERTR